MPTGKGERLSCANKPLPLAIALHIFWDPGSYTKRVGTLEGQEDIVSVRLASILFPPISACMYPSAPAPFQNKTFWNPENLDPGDNPETPQQDLRLVSAADRTIGILLTQLMVETKALHHNDPLILLQLPWSSDHVTTRFSWQSPHSDQPEGMV